MAPGGPVDNRPVPGPVASGLLLALLVAQVAGWLPHYLTWPYWADHDVFAHAAQAWDSGLLPYRDVRLNQTPGTIYLFWLIGRSVGWGRPAWFFGVDAALTFALMAALIAWSRARFGRSGPGLVGALALSATLFDLDYAHAAQRDAQGPELAVLALLIVQARPRSGSALVASAALAALAVAIRPQVVLLVPALVLSAGWLDPERAFGASARRSTTWLALLAVFGAALLAPLAWVGVVGDFAASLRLVAPGSGYNRTGVVEVARRWLDQATEARWWAVAAALIALSPGRPVIDLRLATAWLLVLAGVSLYQPLSPVHHSYLDIPLPVVAAGALALAVAWAGEARVGPGPARVAAVLALAALGAATLRPDFVEFGPALRVVRGWLRPGPTATDGPALPPEPPGYRRGRVATSAFYPWADYAATLSYLRDETNPTTRVANLLKGDPAIAGAIGRLSALPAESVAWLRLVRPEDQAEFAQHLEAETDSVVVWAPGEAGPDPSFRLDALEAVVRRHYQPAARFGTIEVWRRMEAKP